jgi:hypothetical protein
MRLFKNLLALLSICVIIQINAFSQLIWPDDEPAVIWRKAHGSSGSAEFSSSWPKHISEICQDTSLLDTLNATMSLRLKKWCNRYQNAPFFNFTANLSSHSLNKRFPLGDSLDDFGNRNGSALALKVTSEQGKSWKSLPPLAKFEIQYPFSKSTYAYFRFNIARVLDAWHDDELGFNIPWGPADLDINEPSLGYFTWNLPFFALSLGRFPIHWSPSPNYGVSLSSSVPYHDGISLSLKSPVLRYHYLISGFNPWLSGTPAAPGNDFPIGSEEYRQRNPERNFNSRNRIYDEPVKTMSAHRLEIDLKYLEFGITEIVMVGGKNLSLRDGNPFVIFHNNYGDGFSSLGVSVDLKLNLLKKATVFSELFLDELKESDDGGAETRLGWLIGIEHMFQINQAVFYHSIHVIRTDPFLYNHSLPYLTLYSRHIIKSNYIELGSRPFVDTYVIDYPLGYFRGPDAFDLWYDIHGHFTEKISGSLKAGLLRQGEKDPYSIFENKKISSPSGIEETEYRLALSANYQINPHLNTSLGYGCQYLQNLHHVYDDVTFRQQVFGTVSWALY